jgi:hypothetical protein
LQESQYTCTIAHSFEEYWHDYITTAAGGQILRPRFQLVRPAIAAPTRLAFSTWITSR